MNDSQQHIAWVRSEMVRKNIALTTDKEIWQIRVRHFFMWEVPTFVGAALFAWIVVA